MTTAAVVGYTVWANVTTATATTMALNATVAQCNKTPLFTPSKILYTVCMSLILSLSLIGNSIVIWAVVRSPKLKARQTFPFAASLAASDIIMALSQIPCRIVVVINDLTFCFSLAFCYVRQYSDYLGNIASIINLFFVSLDRFIAIERPYEYFQLLTPQRSKICFFSIWLFSSLWGICGMFPWNSPQSIVIDKGWCTTLNRIFIGISFWGIFMPVLLIITCFYVKILKTALTQIRKIETTTCHSEGKSPGRRRRGSQLIKELKTTKSIAIVYVFFSMCWLPGALVVIIKLFDPTYFDMMSLRSRKIIWYIKDILPALSMSINPIIYSFSNSQFREAVKSLWRIRRIRAQTIDYLNQQNTRASCISATEMFSRDRTKFRSNSTAMIVGDSPRSVNAVRMEEISEK